MLNSARMISQDRSRTEHDSFGDIEVPGGALWGAQTERARRNFQLSDTTLPVYGSVDKKTQRAAWTVGDRKDTTYEAGLANLTKSETTMLVHFGKDRTQQWTLVRVEQPADQK